MEKVLERIATDAAFGQQLIRDSEVALYAAGMGEEVEELRALTAEEAEVGAFAASPGTTNECHGHLRPTDYWCHVPSCKITVVSVGYGFA
jgi:hypothetical protein